MSGYVERDGEKYLWIGKRSETKPTYPGMLDHLVAGGLVRLTSLAILTSETGDLLMDLQFAVIY